MSPPVLSCQIPRSAHPAFRPAPAHITEADTVQTVALEHVVLTSEGDPGNGYGVDRHTRSVNGLSDGRKPDPQLDTPVAESVTLSEVEREMARQNWLRRVQYVDPRTRKA